MDSENIVKIVDGQQRLTSIFLLLIACRERAKELSDIKLAQVIQGKISFVNQTTAEDESLRLVSSNSIRTVFEKMAEYSWDGKFSDKLNKKPAKRKSNRIKPIYAFFSNQIENYDKKKLSELLNALYKAYVVKIEITQPEEAFDIFERTNSRGKELEVSDLLKTYLFSKGVKGIENTWDIVVDNSDGMILRMIKYFYVSMKGYTPKSKLYQGLSKYGKEIGPGDLTDKLLSFSKYFTLMRFGDAKEIKDYFDEINCHLISGKEHHYEQIYYSLEGLRLFKVFQVYPLIYSAIYCYKRGGGSKRDSETKKLIELFESLEKFHFINSAITNKVGNEVEKLFANFCLNYNHSNNFIITTNELLSYLKEKIATEEEFTSKFVSDVTYSQSNIPLIAYIFDRINNYQLKPAQRKNIYNSDLKVFKKNFNIEHWLPQKAEEDSEVTQKDSIGNLLAISSHTNSSLGNLSPAAKAKLLRGKLSREVSSLEYVKIFLKKYDKDFEKWGEKQINQRAKEIALDSYNRVWKIR